MRRAPALLGISPGASNAWVVGSGKSSTGRPLLASDPHLGLSIPSTWYEIHLSGGGYDVAGASLPGVPLVLIGRNRRIAWGITALMADVQDLYLETTNPENPRQYAAPDGYRDLEVVAETIAVKNDAAATEEVRVSRHGVIVGETKDGRLLAQRWDALWSGDHFQALLSLNRAGSWEEFTSSLRTWASPPLAFLYADVEGNIGFFPAGEIPVRTAHDGTIPVDGSTDAYEWQGSIPARAQADDLQPRGWDPGERQPRHPSTRSSLSARLRHSRSESRQSNPGPAAHDSEIESRRLRSNPGRSIRLVDGGGAPRRARSQADGRHGGRGDRKASRAGTAR